jgi:hypothetical protein
LPRPTSGSFAQLTTPGILRNLFLAGRTGRLRFSAGGKPRSVWVRDGIPVFGTSTHPGHPPAELLVRAGRLRSEDLREALKLAPSARGLGDLLLELELVRSEDLAWGVLEDARESILSLFTLADGAFTFEDAPLPEGAFEPLDLDWKHLLREGVFRIRDPRVLLRAIGSLDAVFAVEQEPGPRLELELAPEETRLLERLAAGEGETPRDLCRETPLPAIHVCHLLVLLVAAGNIRRIA